jgi:hypothetical protein
MRRHAVVRAGTWAVRLLAYTALSLALGVQVAHASTRPPSAYTGEAAQLTTSSATLNGSVDAGNQPTSYYFQYGTTPGYGGQTPTTPASGTGQSIHVSAPLSGLAVYTTYHYRLAAVNASGTRFGLDRTFTTQKIPLAFSAAASPGREQFGTPFSVTGTLSGTGGANQAVVLQGNQFPYLGGFQTIATTMTSPTGAFSFPATLLKENTQLRVATLGTPPVYSRVMVELVAVQVTLHVRRSRRRGFAQLYGAVTPAEPGSIVAFQLLRSHGRPLSLGNTVITGGTATVSSFSRLVRIRHAGLYRAVAYVASGAQTTNHSRAILIG